MDVSVNGNAVEGRIPQLARGGRSSEDEDGKRVTILSIDGGGMRGIIPLRILQFLETQLQELDGPDARISDYFDIIAGTSTGALIGGLLTIPDHVDGDDEEDEAVSDDQDTRKKKKGRPKFTTKDAMQFFTRDGRKIFAPRTPIPCLSSLFGPKYTAKGLEKILLKNAKDKTMKDTVTELLIPTFDIREMEPIYFSTSEAKCDPLKDARIRNVLRGTSAAPTYFPPTLFYTTDSKGFQRAFNLIDGGIFMNNPTHHAIVYAQKEIFNKNEAFSDRVESLDCTQLMVLSLGTGAAAESYSATQAAKWGALPWVLHDGKSPVIDMAFEGTADVVDYNVSIIFQTQQCADNYLRLQAEGLSGRITAMDNVTPQNVKDLHRVGDELLETTVKIVDLETGKSIPQPQRGTNKQALTRSLSLSFSFSFSFSLSLPLSPSHYPALSLVLSLALPHALALQWATQRLHCLNI